LHNEVSHQALPFLCEKRKVEGKFTKLITSLHNKKRYVTHLSVLQQALKHGLILTRVRRGISFNQTDFLNKFVQKYVKKRAEATSEWLKRYYKLVLNSLFGL
jgi:xanthine dehydrogenase molybdopterin-binding subunit B